MLNLQVPEWPYDSKDFMSILPQYANNNPKGLAFTFIDYSSNKPGDYHLSYADLDRRARQIAALLQTRCPAGQRVLLIYPSGLDYICAFFGCLYAGMIAVPVYPPLNPRLKSRLVAVTDDCKASIALTTSSLLKEQGNKSELPVPLSSLHWLVTDEGLDAFEFAWNEPNIKIDDIALIQYTSGSTGHPKGVMVTHRNLLHNLYAIALHFQFNTNDHHLTWLPPYHDMGLIGAILGSFAAGVPLSFMMPTAFLRRPERWLQEISARRCTFSGAPNFAYELCLAKITDNQIEDLDLSSWTLAFSGAEPVKMETLERFSKRFTRYGFKPQAFYPCYGMAETTLFVTGVNRLKKPTAFIADKEIYATKLRAECLESSSLTENEVLPIVSCGVVADGLSVEIVDAKTGLLLPDQDIGEIWVKGPSVTAGYWNREEETKATFKATLPGKEGYYLRTGDMGFKHNCEIYISGRLKDLIIVHGVNHYPHDIEASVNHCHEAIKPGCGIAFSIEKNEKERLVFVQEVVNRDKEYAQEIFIAIKNAIADQQDLQVYAIALIENGSIPKTTSGKLSRRPCRESFLNSRLSVIASWQNPLFNETNKIIDVSDQSLRTHSVLEPAL